MRRLVLALTPFVLSACPGASDPASNTPAKSDAPRDARITDPPPVEPPATTPQAQAAVARSINAFGVDFYRRTAATPGNLVVSPASLAFAFAMTYAGAQGQTAQELSDAFHFDLAGDSLHEGFAGLMAAWNEAGEVELAVANRLFAEKTYTFEAPFVELTRTLYGAPMQPMDFRGAADGSRREINAWVEQRTKDRIRELLPAGSIDGSTRLVLTNAIYLKADWLVPFEREATRPAPFHAKSGDVQAPTMAMSEHLAFAADPAAGVKLLQLPYKGPRLAMLLVLPDAVDGLAAVEAKLDPAALERWAAAVDAPAAQGLVELQLPKLVIDPPQSTPLRATLEAMGVRRAFDEEQAQFEKMAPAPPPLYISEAFHKAFIEVDEKGTEAAAATAVVMAEGAGMLMAPPVSFHVDHPFLFVLRDRVSGAVLFMGRVEDPTAKG
jgi:serpin B